MAEDLPQAVSWALSTSPASGDGFAICQQDLNVPKIAFFPITVIAGLTPADDFGGIIAWPPSHAPKRQGHCGPVFMDQNV